MTITETYQQLRTKHQVFSYQSFAHTLEGDDFICEFTYHLEPNLTFHHRVSFHQIDTALLCQQNPDLIDNLVFHLGLIEMFSYWKLAASPLIQIDAGSLSAAQLDFWHQLLLDGMGEYFYVNQIPFYTPDFVHIEAKSNATTSPNNCHHAHQGRRNLVNLGGGKDSATMLTMLQESNEDFATFIIQPSSPAAHAQAQLAGKITHTAARHFDPQLTELNARGYLNGHVPFSASVAFNNLLAGVLYDCDFCLVGNEASADEVSLYWREQPINHQFSKSTKFEQSFQTYCSQYLINNVKYFSLLRPFNEFQIAQFFCTNPVFFDTARSCNRGQKQNIWCAHCPKCLFVYLLLSPFLPANVLHTRLFSHSLLDDLSLQEILSQLLGLSPAKPLECVGTRDESQAAFYLLYTKCIQSQQPLPALIAALAPQVLALRSDWDNFALSLSTAWHQTNTLPDWAQKLTRHYYQKLPLST